MSKYFNIAILILFALAVLLGLLNRRQNQPQRTNAAPAAATGVSQSLQEELQNYFKTARDLAAGQNHSPNPAEATFLGVGDIMLSRNVAAQIAKRQDPLLPFERVANLLNSTDFNFANLESPIDSSLFLSPSAGRVPPGRGERLQIYQVPTGSLIFKAAPDDMQGLKTYNFQILNLANNHAFDQGKAGIDYTKQFLEKQNILHIGAGSSLEEAWQPQIVDVKGIKIGFVGASYASINDGGKTKNNYIARIEDADKLKSEIFNLKSKSDFIVVAMHAGTEYSRNPNVGQIAFAHAAIDAGADIVIGAHPHWIQTVEKYHNKYIFYSLGNFIFDQEWSRETKQGLAIKVTISKPINCHPAQTPGEVEAETERSLSPLQIKNSSTLVGMTCGDGLQGPRAPAQLKQIELVPVIIENYCCPRLANNTEAQSILKKINQPNLIIAP